VTVTDTTAPSLTAPAAVNAATGPGSTACGVVVSDTQLGTATASDNCAGAITLTRSGVPAANLFPVGTTTITYMATDAAGNTRTATQTVTVSDTTAPVITCPGNLTAVFARPTDASVVVAYAAPAASDNCAGGNVVCSPPSGSGFPVGVTTVTCTARDAAGNQATCSFTVTAWDVLLHDVRTGDTLRINSATGDYHFTRCSDRLTLTGRARVLTNQACLLQIQDQQPTRTVNATAYKCASYGSATISGSGMASCSITDPNLANHVGACP
jgi:hypothetical protein